MSLEIIDALGRRATEARDALFLSALASSGRADDIEETDEKKVLTSDERAKLDALRGAAARDVGTTVGTVAAGDDDRITGALQPTSIFSVPAYLAPFIEAPPIINPRGFPWPIFSFNGGAAEYNKDTGVADYQRVWDEGLNSGEKIRVPKHEIPIRTFKAGANGISFSGDVDVEVDQGAVIIAGENFWGADAGAVFSFGAPISDDTAAVVRRFRWRGGLLSGRELTAAHGTGSGFSCGLMSVAGYFNAVLEDVFFDIGTVSAGLNSVGAGAMDTCLGWNQNIGGALRNNGFRGPFDVAVYGIGRRFTSTLAANPLTTTNGSNIVVVAAPAHGMRNGDRCFLQGIVAFNGITFPNGEYAVSSVATNTFSITMSPLNYPGNATQNASAGGAGGGSAVVLTNSRTNKTAASIHGEGTVFEGNWFARCNNAMSIKRNMRFLTIRDNLIKECANGIATAGVGEYKGGEGKSLIITNNKILRTLNWPIRLQGAGAETIVSENIIQDWGRQIYGTFDPVTVSLAAGAPAAGIEILSMDSAEVINNHIGMLDYYIASDWVAGREPVAVKFDKNPDYISGCVDCVAAGNIIRNVPKPFYDGADNSRSIWRKTNSVRSAVAVLPNLYNASSNIETSKQISQLGSSLAAAGSANIAVAHGLDFTPPKAACSVDFGSASGGTVMTGITAQISATDATSITIALNNPTAQAGKVLDLYVKINIG
jgi:hypothetical protein